MLEKGRYFKGEKLPLSLKSQLLFVLSCVKRLFFLLPQKYKKVLSSSLSIFGLTMLKCYFHWGHVIFSKVFHSLLVFWSLLKEIVFEEIFFVFFLITYLTIIEKEGIIFFLKKRRKKIFFFLVHTHKK